MKPEPKATHVVCTACGLNWDKHLAGPRKKNPTLEDCVRVLKAELGARPRMLSNSSSSALPVISYAQGGGQLS